jgi:peroxiredoxin (alkyl hydroperoxide reductase subunit C)
MPAIIGQQAPAFKGQAIVDGMIKEISLDDFKGVWSWLLIE